MIRHPKYTRARLGRLSERLCALVYPETRYRPVEIGERFGPYRPHQIVTVVVR